MSKTPKWLTDEQYVDKLEAFMQAVAKELKCLPSFADPTPEDGNAHIMRKLRELTANPALSRRSPANDD